MGEIKMGDGCMGVIENPKRGRKGVLIVATFYLFLGSCGMIEPGKVEESLPDPYGQTDKDQMVIEMKEDESRVTKPEPKARPKGPIEVNVKEAILIAMENNRSLSVERYNPTISNTFEEQETAVFDPVLRGATGYSKEEATTLSRATGRIFGTTIEGGNLNLSGSQFFATGTDVIIEAGTNWDSSGIIGDLYETRAGLSVTQALLRGRGSDVNLATLRQAGLNTKISDYELRGFVETLVAQVEQTYWDYALAERQVKILEDSLKLAEQQLWETEEMIKVGRMAETEIAAVNAEIALRRQNLITARATLTTTGLLLLRLLNPPGSDLWNRKITLLVQPTLPKVDLEEVEAHVKVALRMRPDLNQARLSFQIDELQIVKTKNGLLPIMDLFITLGKTGYADSFGSSVSHITDDYYDLSAAIRLEYPFRNRDAKARYGRSLLQYDQAAQAIENLAQLVELDVRTAYVDVNREREQITATRATRQSQEETLRVETEKFRVGRSTNFLVAQAQRDLVLSQLSEVQAIANYLKAIVELYRLEGSLLERYGISVPGREPIPSFEEENG